MAVKPLAVIVEVGPHRTFASALDWPGWCRSGRTEPDALDALVRYAARYAEVARRAELTFSPRLPDQFDVVERMSEGATTDFGAPGAAAQIELAAVTAPRAARLAALLRGAWVVLDEVAGVTPPTLRKGPRGGGRDRDKMLDHVLSAEASYARSIGIKRSAAPIGDTAAIDEFRQQILAVVGHPQPARVVGEKGWSTAYAARRIAWHVLDHAWEMQDRTES